VVDSNGLRREGRSTATQGGVEGDGLVDDGSGVGRGEGKMGGLPLSGVVTLIVTTLLVDA